MEANVIVPYFLEELIQLLKHEVLLRGVEDQARSFAADLNFMNIFLSSSGAQRNRNDMVKELVEQILEVVIEAEDVIETYVVEKMKLTKKREDRLTMSKVSSFFNSRHRVLNLGLSRVTETTHSIKSRIEEIYRNREKYGIDMIEAMADPELDDSLQKLRTNVEEDDVVGFKIEAEKLVKQLREGGALKTISIIGMGGSGKTTLARKIYNDASVKNHFKYRVWVNVSQKYKKRDILLDILRGMTHMTEGIDEIHNDEELKMKLKDFLVDKRYLIVLDDVWNPEIWEEFRYCFPQNDKGSRILFTTRIREVAAYANSSTVHSLPLLTKEESWELFSNKVFRGKNCPKELEEIGRRIAMECSGLPLAIVILAGTMANEEKSREKWELVVKNMRQHHTQEPTILSIQALSYNGLSDHLKPCFLYLGVFPEDIEISGRQLIHLWVAERFIQGQANIRPEEMAEQYLRYLIDRGLVQVATKRTVGGVKTCRIHRSLLELCIREGTSQKFFEVCVKDDGRSPIKARRISVQGDGAWYPNFGSGDFPAVRTLLFFDKSPSHNKMEDAPRIPEDLRFVRVLDMGRFFQCTPRELEMRVFLRFLRIDDAELEKLMPAICKLYNLETLDARGGPYDKRPQCLLKGIWNMRQLRHLYTSKSVTLPVPPEDDESTMDNLQTLSTLRPNEASRLAMEKGKFPNLTKLGLCGSSVDTQHFLESLHHLQHLRTLKIMEDAKLHTDPKSYPSSLTKITLEETKLSPECIELLGKLPNLRILKLRTGSVRDEHIKFSAGSFPNLQTFHMNKMNTKSLEMEEGAMNRLQHVFINDCVAMDNLPQQLRGMTSQQVTVLSPHPSLRPRLEEGEEER